MAEEVKLSIAPIVGLCLFAVKKAIILSPQTEHNTPFSLDLYWLHDHVQITSAKM